MLDNSKTTKYKKCTVIGFQKSFLSICLMASVASLLATFNLTAVASENKASLETPKAWMDKKLTSEQRADLVLKEMTMDEKLKLVFGHFGNNADWKNYKRIPEARPQSAGFVHGVPRLGIPNLWETDAGVGVASQLGPTSPAAATALPSGMNTTATWDIKTAEAGGAMIGSEARSYGFNVMLAGGANITREPRNGRNFEYGGEDPLLAGVMVGAQIRGIQSNHIISTLKHFALNDQETGRFHLNAIIDDKSARMSDLLAMQFAFEQGNPGSVMCGYNRVNGVYACESDYLLNEVLKKDWGFKGWVMSDWGGTHSTVPAANNGLDQQSGYPIDKSDYFNVALKEAVENGWVPESRLNDMARRVLFSMFEFGVIDHPVTAPDPKAIDYKAHALVSMKDSQEGMVLLKNASSILPINKSVKKIAIIGGYADKGVLAGGGSSLVHPIGGNAMPELEPKWWPGPVMVYPNSPLEAVRARAGQAQVTFNDGKDAASAAALASTADVVLVFATQWTTETIDVPDLSLPNKQNELISAVAKANSKTVVILETGGPVVMPWINDVAAVIEAWYPGTAGGEAIASVLFGEVNPSGHLPVTFPESEMQLPRPVLDGYPEVQDKRFDVKYTEGAAVGYKWFDLKGYKPLFPFGHGLSYTTFELGGLKADVKGGVLSASFSVKNTGKVVGKEVAQIYVAPVSATWEAPKRLAGFKKVMVKPGSSVSASVTIDPRILGVYDSKTKTWFIAEGDYKVSLAADAMDAKASSVITHLPAQTFDVRGKLIN